MKKVGILYHPKVEATKTKARELQKSLASGGISVWLCSSWEKEQSRELLNGTDLVVSVGGDGTILRAAQVVLGEAVPIVGVNMGRVGFLTELATKEAEEKLPRLLAGEGWTDERAMLQAELTSGGREPRTFHALNEVLLARGGIARVVRIEVTIDGETLTTYKADGVIVATATGSTGYSLAAGGPVIHPASKDRLIVPIAPHLSLGYPLVLPASSTIELRASTVHDAILSVDGHINLPLSGEDLVKIKLSPHTTRFLRMNAKGYFFGSLEQRLKGK